MAAALTSAVRAADRREAYRRDGALSMKPWLRGSCRMAPDQATSTVSTGRRLEQLPETAAAFAAGEISAAHARVITRAMTPGRIATAADAGIDLGETDGILADLARATAPKETARGVAQWVAGVDPDGTLDDAADVRRRFSMASGLDGRVHLRGDLDAVGGEYLHSALAALMNGDRPAGEMRCHAERQADALVSLARGALNGGSLPDVRGERPHVRVTIDWMALCAERGAPGVAGGPLGWSGPINSETARRLACDASVSRVITGPDGLPLDVGRAGHSAGSRCELASGGGRSGPSLHRLRRPAGVVRRPPRRALGARRPDELRQRGTALRAAPHVLPRRRVHHRARSRHRPLAHLPARRHRDPHQSRPLNGRSGRHDRLP
jgi:hypothetical protein